MKYSESGKDARLRNWFNADYSIAALKGIQLQTGQLRGINNLELTLQFPITAIAGRNGAGKSTILALASCAYHNSKDGFRLPKRQYPYYTFRDFFIQHADEVPLQGVEIHYHIAHNNWKKGEYFPNGTGVGLQKRIKRKGGKWSDYSDRVPRNVVFLGIERIVPHAERSQSRSYSRAFKDAKIKGWEDKVKDAVGFVLQKTYDKFRYLEYYKYSLPMVQQGETIYSGFNMGAGESALFEIFSTMYSCGNGGLLVIDEMELGLHAEAQRRFVDRLKDVCLDLRAQVIGTTHSREIFESLPSDARFFIESINGKTVITGAISAEFAFSKLGAACGTEMDIFVEDEVAQSVVSAALPSSTRRRVSVKVIGSASAVARQLAAHYIRRDAKPILALLDGDQRSNEKDLLNYARNLAENPKSDFEHWFRDHISFLPGGMWPEAWLVEKAQHMPSEFCGVLGATVDVVTDALAHGRRAPKHSEFFEISRQLGLSREQCLHSIVTILCASIGAEFADLRLRVSQKLS